MAKIYVKKANRDNYLKHGIINKIKKAIKAHKDKKYILIKKVISNTDAQKCIKKKNLQSSIKYRTTDCMTGA